MEPLLSLLIPTLPPSVNTHHTFRYVFKNGKRSLRVELSDEAAKWKRDASYFMRPCKGLSHEWRYRVEIRLVTRWYDKSGVPLKKDCRNHGKLVVDAVFERYGLNDKLVWYDVVEKVHHDTDERVEFRMWRHEAE